MSASRVRQDGASHFVKNPRLNCGSYHSSPDQHGHQQGDGGDQLAEVVHPAETRFQPAESPVTDWHFECYQLVCDYFLLLLLAGLFFDATVSRLNIVFP